MAQPRVACLDGLRALGVVTVVWQHSLQTRGSEVAAWLPLPPAVAAMRMFFAISGLVITYLLLKEREQTGAISLGGFYLRRCRRILPALAVYLVFVAAADAFTAVEEPPLEWITSLTFTKNVYGRSWITGHLWSLSVEEQFYVVWPLLVAWLGPRLRPLTLLALIPLPALTRFALMASGHFGMAHVSLPANADFLMSGAAIAIALRRGTLPGFGAWRVAIPFAAVVVVRLCTVVEDGDFPLLARALAPTVQAAAIGLTIADLVTRRDGPLFRFLNARAVVYVGFVSYSWYLWQQAALSPPSYYGFDLPIVQQWPTNIPVSFAIAAASYQWIEKPFLRR